jgi:hypothetical protein
MASKGAEDAPPDLIEGVDLVRSVVEEESRSVAEMGAWEEDRDAWT